jgi:hypothetical protein
MEELRRYGVSICALSETRWSGSDAYNIGGYKLLTSGFPLPADGEGIRRERGVALALDAVAVRAWEAAGSQWEAVSPRLLTARFKFTKSRPSSSKAVAQCKSRRRRARVGARPRNWRRGPQDLGTELVTVFSVYAPTSSATEEDTSEFYDQLQAKLAAVPAGESVIIVGDMNARVGSNTGDENLARVLGNHGLGNVNKNGRTLLSFCALNDLAIMNTMFKKLDIHKATWKHPACKDVRRPGYCLDYVIVRQAKRRSCIDVSVRRGADIESDHYLVKAKFHYRVPVKKAAARRARRFDVKPLGNYLMHNKTWNHRANDDEVDAAVELRKKFMDELVAVMESTFAWRGGVEAQWETLVNGLTVAAENSMGFDTKRVPDWFRDGRGELDALIAKRNEAYQSWLRANSARAKAAYRAEYKKRRGATQRAVRAAKNSWFQAKAEEMTKAMDKWRIIDQIKRNRGGYATEIATSIKKKNGDVCMGPEETLFRWREHFEGVLNVESVFNAEKTIDQLPQREVMHELDEPPSFEEIQKAVMSLGYNRTSGDNGILAELLKFSCPRTSHPQELDDGMTEEGFLKWLAPFFAKVWECGHTPQAWRDAVIVALPKKGDLSSCDNWRGISLLDVIGKMFARVMQNRLQKLASIVLPDSQCGFRNGRGCLDMIFSIRQLFEKVHEHHTTAFAVFVDLKKAYDSVPREALWALLVKLGVPAQMVAVIRSFHDGMTAVVRADGTKSESFNVSNGLRQGCTMAPVLFNLYFSAVMGQWRESCTGLGITLNHNNTPAYKNRLLSKKASQSKSHQPRLYTEFQFADDAAAITTKREGMVEAVKNLVSIAADWGLSVSIPKTECLAVGTFSPEDVAPIPVEGGEIKFVKKFKYLGSVLSDQLDGGVTMDVGVRCGKATAAYAALSHAVFEDKALTLKTRIMVYKAAVWGTLLYGAEAWAIKKSDVRKMEVVHNRCIRKLLGVSNLKQKEERLSSDHLNGRAEITTVEEELVKRRLRWLGHVARMEDDRIPKAMLFSQFEEKRWVGGVRKRWKDVLKADATERTNLETEKWYNTAKDRELWSEDTSLLAKEEKVVEPAACEFCGKVFDTGILGVNGHKKHCTEAQMAGPRPPAKKKPKVFVPKEWSVRRVGRQEKFVCITCAAKGVVKELTSTAGCKLHFRKCSK